MFLEFKNISIKVMLALLVVGVVHAEADNYNDKEACCYQEFDDSYFNACNTGCRQYQVKCMGELLYWRALEDGFDSGCCSNWKNYHWNAAYRVSLACQSNYSGCQAALIWTHYEQEPHYGSLNECGGIWKLSYQTLDGLAIGSVLMNPCLELKPFWGVRGAWIRQKAFSLAHLSSNCKTDDFTLIKEREGKADFNAGGPLIGLSAEYKVNHCFCFFGGGSIGLLYGNHQLKSFGSNTFTNPDETCTCECVRNNQASQLFLDVAFGVRWEQCICKNVVLLHQLGFEHHRYFGFNQFGSLGDLCFDGVNLSVGIGF